MNNRPTPLERAFELAGSGQQKSVDEIRTRLKLEGFDTAQLYGRTLANQLREKIKRALAGNVGDETPSAH